MVEVKNDSYWQYVWNQFKEGDKESFAIIYNHQVDALYRYASKLSKDEHAIKDAIQEIFMELYLKRETVKTTPEFLKFYLLLALKRNLIKKNQSSRKIQQLNTSESNDFEVDYNIESQLIEIEENSAINRQVLDALNQLPAKQKEAVYLRFNQALEYEEVAAILEISVESVRKQVYRAIKTLREIIGNESSLILISLFQKKV